MCLRAGRLIIEERKEKERSLQYKAEGKEGNRMSTPTCGFLGSMQLKLSNTNEKRFTGERILESSKDETSKEKGTLLSNGRRERGIWPNEKNLGFKTVAHFGCSPNGSWTVRGGGTSYRKGVFKQGHPRRKCHMGVLSPDVEPKRAWRDLLLIGKKTGHEGCTGMGKCRGRSNAKKLETESNW